VVKAGLKKEEAEELKKKLEAGTTYTSRQCTHYMHKAAILIKWHQNFWPYNQVATFQAHCVPTVKCKNA